MKLTDTLDQILRMLLATNGSTASEPAGTSTLQADRAEQTTGERISSDLARAAASLSMREEATHEASEVESTTAEPEGALAEVEDAPPVEKSEAAAEVELGHPALETTADLVERLGLGFHLGSAIERIATAAGEGSEGAPRLHEATWLIQRYLDLLERRPVGADLHLTMMRLAREGDAIAGLQALATALEERPERALPATQAEPEPQPPAPEVTVEASQPSVRRELLVMTLRTGIVILAVVVVVVLLTLIAQWR